MWAPHPLHRECGSYFNDAHLQYLFSPVSRHRWPGRHACGEGPDGDAEGDGRGEGLPDDSYREHRRFDDVLSMLCWVLSYKGHY